VHAKGKQMIQNLG